jgi:ABC-2 type transport system ATP-binding protein
MITVRGLTKEYAHVAALKGIDFEVAQGEIVGFLGPNGAGKTTTLRILTGFMPATDGDVRVGGFDVRSESRAVRKTTGYLPEDVPLYRDLSVTDFLGYMAGLKEVPPGSLRGEIERVISLAGLETVRDRLLSKCSKGYRQRAGLAMALLGDPSVLLLDEPTSGLDPNQVAEVREFIRGLGGTKTVLLSSHILSEVSQICGRVLIVHEGRLVAAGAPEDLARRYGTGQRLVVRARGGRLEALGALPGVLRVDSPAPGICHVTVEDAEAAAPLVAQALIGQGAQLLELRREAIDLEAVFRAVTAARGEEPV